MEAAGREGKLDWGRASEDELFDLLYFVLVDVISKTANKNKTSWNKGAGLESLSPARDFFER